MKQVRVQVLLDKDMAESFKDEAKSEGRSVSSLIKYKLKKYEELRGVKYIDASNMVDLETPVKETK